MASGRDEAARAHGPQAGPAATIPALFFEAARRWSGEELGRYYEDGIRLGIPWDDADARVRQCGSLLLDLGVVPGERVGLIAETSHLWTACDIAILAAAGVTLGIYPTSKPAEIAFILADAGARVAIVESAALARALVEQRAQTPELRVVLVLHAAERGALPAAEGLDVRLLGDALAPPAAEGSEGRAAFDARWQAVAPDDLATLVYTSGTTGPPKGVMLTHGNLVHTARVMARVLPLDRRDRSLVYLPLAHAFQRVTAYVGLITGVHGTYAERLDDLPRYLAEVRPTILAGVPRVYEKVQAKVLARVAAGPRRRRRIFQWALSIGRRVAAARREGRPVPLLLSAQHALADRLVLARVRAAFGGSVRVLGSGAAPISIDTLEFFHACGLLIIEGYGLTETSAPVTMNTPEAFRFGTVGRAIEGCALRIAADGEVLCCGPNVTAGYWNRPEANADSFTTDEDGVRWFLTGDIGSLDDDGYLRITDRKKELIITAGGKNVAPQPIETALRGHPLVEMACVVGDRERYLAALLALDVEEAVAWARREGLPPDPVALVEHKALRAILQVHVDQVNASLARYETIKRFAVLPQPFRIEDDTLTPTQKLRRRGIAERYADVIGGLFAA